MRTFANVLGSLAVSAGLAASGEPLTLEGALALARANNETPKVAQARMDQARAARDELISALVPAGTLSGTYTRRSREVTRIVDGKDYTLQARDALLGNLQVRATLFDARLIPGVKRAETLVVAQDLDAAELIRALEFEVARAFVAVLSAEQLRDAADRRVEVAEATVADATGRFDAGLAGRNEVTRSELELATARLSATTARNTVRRTRLALSYLLDADTTGPLADPPPPSEVGREPEILAGEAAGHRKDLQALEARARAAELLARVPRMEWVPALGLLGNYYTTNESGLSGQDSYWNVATTLSWSFFDGGGRSARAAARDAEARESRLQADALRRKVRVELDDALASIETAEAALTQAEAQLRVASDNAEEVAEQFRQGLATGLERADASVSEFEARAGLVREGLALRLSQLALLETLGRGPLGEESVP